MKYAILFLMILVSSLQAHAQTSCNGFTEWQTRHAEKGEGDEGETSTTLSLREQLSQAESFAYLAVVIPYMKKYSRDFCLPEEVEAHRRLSMLQESVNYGESFKTDDAAMKDFDKRTGEIKTTLMELRKLNQNSVRQGIIEEDLNLFQKALNGDKKIDVVCSKIISGDYAGIIRCTALRETVAEEDSKTYESSSVVFNQRPQTRFPIGVLYFSHDNDQEQR